MYGRAAPFASLNGGRRKNLRDSENCPRFLAVFCAPLAYIKLALMSENLKMLMFLDKLAPANQPLTP
jgi:hypothetical protein